MRNIKTGAAALIAAVVLLSGCGGNEKTSGTRKPQSESSGTAQGGNTGTSQPDSGLEVSEPETSSTPDISEMPATSESEFKYEINSEKGGVVVNGYDGESLMVKIPDTIEGKSVVEVNFLGVPKPLTHISMPNSVTKFQFSHKIRQSLEYANIPESMTEIEMDAFRESKLTNVVIPDGMTKIGSGAFMYCENLESVTIPDSVTEIGSSAFNGCKKLTSVNIPNGVTVIGVHTFQDCKSLTSITIPDSVTEIESGAFKGCTDLYTVIPDSVTKIGTGAFSGCENMRR